VRDQCIPLPEPEKAAAFGPFFDRFAQARLVLLGEATHGASEFYNARAAITQRLITDHGSETKTGATRAPARSPEA